MKSGKFVLNKSIGLLLDPDSTKGKALDNLLGIATASKVDYILAGGSITFNSIETLVTKIKENCSIPVILFPGNLMQLSHNTDFIFLLSLISGRNPELLIGNHVLAAPYLKDIFHKLIPTGYILVNCGTKTSVEYMSQTEAIPIDKTDIAVATAMAGEMLGLKMIYLEGGSSASTPVPVSMVKSVKENISIPLAVGGGLRSAKEVESAFIAGADLIVLGNGCEKDPTLLTRACEVRDKIRDIY